MKTARPLEDVVRAWLKDGAPLLVRGDWFLDPRFLDDVEPPDESKHSGLIKPIRDAAGTEWKDVNDQELTSAMLDELAQALADARDLPPADKRARAIKRIANRLLLPHRKYRFSTPIALRGSIPEPLDIGGRHELKLVNDSARTGVVLSGTVAAVTEERP